MNDPIHGVMRISGDWKKFISPIIDHPHFQRLRHIKQLGLTDLIFPGATHTRFSHCIGAAHIADQMTANLEIKGRLREEIILACLLHDIGHGPFSHAFEQIFETKTNEVLIRHEKWTGLFLKEIPELKKKFDPTKIGNIIERKDKGPKVKRDGVWDIVSSGLDADRLDYLLRDSYFCGVPYGHVDLKWILHCVRQITNGPGKPMMGICPKGIGAVEHFLMARRLMTKYVYFHPKVVVVEYLLIEFLKELSKYLLKKTSVPLNEDLIIFLKNSAEFMRQKNAESKSRKTISVEKFMGDNFNFYKNLKDSQILDAITYFSQPKFKKQPVGNIASTIYSRRLPDTYTLDGLDIGGIKYETERFKKKHGIPNWEMTIRTPRLKSYTTTYPNAIFIEQKGRAKESIERVSTVIGGLSNRTEEPTFLMVHKRIRRKVRNFLKSLKLREPIR